MSMCFQGLAEIMRRENLLLCACLTLSPQHLKKSARKCDRGIPYPAMADSAAPNYSAAALYSE